MKRTPKTVELDAERTERLLSALARALDSENRGAGVGTLSEKLLHKTLKLYIEPDAQCHERPVLGSIADILIEDGITEVQTRAFERLVPKLRRFLPEYSVTVVHPLVASRYVTYIDRETGEILKRVKSPKHDGVNRAACELYKIAEFLCDKALTVKLVFIDFEDFRYKKEGTGRTKPSANLIERRPVAVVRELTLRHSEDYRIFLPDTLAEVFTAEELRVLIKLDSRRTHNTLRLLLSLGLIERCGVRGKAYLYRKTE